jgi:hypothetical protein
MIPSDFISSYYITVKHRNHLETVSKTAQSFASTKVVYNFKSTATQAYGDNQKLLSAGVYGIYGGDVNQNGFIDINDAGIMNPGILVGDQGYLVTDVNGDGFVDINDAGTVNPSILISISAQKPN